MISSRDNGDGVGPTAVARVLAALADPTRLRILALLRGGDLCVCEIQQGLGVSQPTVSRHLSHLRHAGLVATRRDGLWVHYQLASNVTEALHSVVEIVEESVATSPEGEEDRSRLAVLPRCCAPDHQPRRLP